MHKLAWRCLRSSQKLLQGHSIVCNYCISIDYSEPGIAGLRPTSSQITHPTCVEQAYFLLDVHWENWAESTIPGSQDPLLPALPTAWRKNLLPKTCTVWNRDGGLPVANNQKEWRYLNSKSASLVDSLATCGLSVNQWSFFYRPVQEMIKRVTEVGKEYRLDLVSRGC